MRRVEIDIHRLDAETGDLVGEIERLPSTELRRAPRIMIERDHTRRAAPRRFHGKSAGPGADIEHRAAGQVELAKGVGEFDRHASRVFVAGRHHAVAEVDRMPPELRRDPLPQRERREDGIKTRLPTDRAQSLLSAAQGFVAPQCFDEVPASSIGITLRAFQMAELKMSIGIMWCGIEGTPICLLGGGQLPVFLEDVAVLDPDAVEPRAATQRPPIAALRVAPGAPVARRVATRHPIGGPAPKIAVDAGGPFPQTRVEPVGERHPCRILPSGGNI